MELHYNNNYYHDVQKIKVVNMSRRHHTFFFTVDALVISCAPTGVTFQTIMTYSTILTWGASMVINLAIITNWKIIIIMSNHVALNVS